MEDVDYVAARTVIAALAGGISGASMATFRGHNPITLASRMAGTWAMAATACIGSQRLFCAAAQYLIQPVDEKSDAMLVGTHTMGGIMGGGLLGYLYIRKPIRGMIFLTPVMLLVSLVEIRYEEQKRLDPSQLANKIKPTRTIDGGLVEEKESSAASADDATKVDLAPASEKSGGSNDGVTAGRRWWQLWKKG